MKMKNIMTVAWNIARKGAKQFGGKVKEYFSEALHMAWNLYKKTLAKKGGNILGLAPWFIRKSFGHESMVQQLNGDSPLFIKKSTKKANLIEYIIFENGIELDRATFWAPKSVCI